MTQTQNEVFDFLIHVLARNGEIRRVDTHAASVFLAGDRAYKVKRAVRLPYLDYSSVELRREACVTELDINRRFSPHLYLRVVSVTREKDGTLRLDGSGLPVEWIVEMRRFDETLDEYCRHSAISPEMIDAIAVKLADHHAQAERADPETWLSSLTTYVDQCLNTFLNHGKNIDREEARALADKSKHILGDLNSLIRERAHAGLLIQGHGDLHLANIAVIDGSPYIFDAIEFDRKVAAGDVLYDLAFALMDLVVHGQEKAANGLLNRYVVRAQREENFTGLKLLPLFLSLRAAIRAAVTCEKLDRAGKYAPEVAGQMQRYFSCAREFLAPPRPRLIVIGGLSGTGKSVLARDLAHSILPYPGAIVIRSDVERKRMLGIPEQEKAGPSAYEPSVTRAVYERIAAYAAQTIAAGHSVILDAVYGSAAEREMVSKMAKNQAIQSSLIFLKADLPVRLARIAGRTRDASDADAAVATAQESWGEDTIDWAIVDASGSPDQTLASAKAAIDG